MKDIKSPDDLRERRRNAMSDTKTAISGEMGGNTLRWKAWLAVSTVIAYALTTLHPRSDGSLEFIEVAGCFLAGAVLTEGLRVLMRRRLR